MQAVILAAGRSSRFLPFRNFSHKSLIEIMGKPIISHTIDAVRRSGINDLILVVSKNSEIKKYFGDGSGFGVNITYVIQDEATGSGNGLLLCEKIIKDDFFLVNVSRVDFDLYKSQMLERKHDGISAVLLGKRQEYLDKYGVLKFDKDRVLDLVEKPSKGKEPSDTRIVGIYLFSKNFFGELRKAPDEHYSLEKAIASFAKSNDVRLVHTSDEVPSLKYSWDLLELKNFLLSRITKSSIGNNVTIAKGAVLKGPIIIENNAQILESAKIIGPCYIGESVTVGTNVILRGGVDLEANCVVGANLEIKNSLFMKNTKAHSGYIGDSIVGESVRIGAGFNTANKRIDRETISVTINDAKIDTKLKNLGAIIGSNVRIGLKSSTMPGVMIGENSIIGPSTNVMKNVSEDTKYYAKFQEIIEKKVDL